MEDTKIHAWKNSRSIGARLAKKSMDPGEAVCGGLAEELALQNQKVKRLLAVHHTTEVVMKPRDDDIVDQSVDLDEEAFGIEEAWDDVTGSALDPQEVRRARLKELKYVEEMKVWKKIPRAEAARRGIKVILVRWIDINKGDGKNPNYRSRLVAKEFNT